MTAPEYRIESQHAPRKKYRSARTLAGVGLDGAVRAFHDYVGRVVGMDAWDRTRRGRTLRLVGPKGEIVETVDIERRRKRLLGQLAGEMAEGRVADLVAGAVGGTHTE